MQRGYSRALDRGPLAHWSTSGRAHLGGRPLQEFPQSHSPVSPFKKMPHGRGMGDEGGLQGLDVDGARKIMVKMTTS